MFNKMTLDYFNTLCNTDIKEGDSLNTWADQLEAEDIQVYYISYNDEDVLKESLEIATGETPHNLALINVSDVFLYIGFPW